MIQTTLEDVLAALADLDVFAVEKARDMHPLVKCWEAIVHYGLDHIASLVVQITAQCALLDPNVHVDFVQRLELCQFEYLRIRQPAMF